MARRTRKEILGDGECYHVIARGNGKRAIFKCKRDYKNFINIVHGYLEKFPILIYHYCLMKNHAHFLIKAISGQALPKFMQRILQKYAVYFIRKYDSPGHLFQNRYKSYLIDKESYLLECGRYIERNPLRAKIVDNLYDYPWSSFNFYAKGEPDILITNPNPAYLEFGLTEKERQKNYAEYVLKMEPS
jgi:putative transposase